MNDGISARAAAERPLAQAFVEAFAAHWLQVWNAHDLDAIMAHYHEDLVFSSSKLARLLPETGGRLHGKAAVRAYWARALQRRPDLRFTAVCTMGGTDSLVIHYIGLDDQRCAETFHFDAQGLVIASHAHGSF